MRRWKRILLVLFLMLAVLIALPFAALYSETVTRWTLPRILAFIPGDFNANHSGGTLAGPLTLTDIRWRYQGTALDVQTLSLDWRPLALLGGELDILSIEINAPLLTLLPGKEKARAQALNTQELLQALKPPLDIRVHDVIVRDFSLRLPEREINNVNLTGKQLRFDKNGISIESLDARQYEYHLHLAGMFATAAPFSLEIQAHHNFEISGWHLRGTLNATGTLDELELEQHLELPAPAYLNASAFELLTNPRWQGEIRIAEFDVAQLHAKAPEARAGLTLNFSGTPEATTVTGRVQGSFAPWSTLDIDMTTVLGRDGIEVRQARVTAQPGDTDLTLHGALAWRETFAYSGNIDVTRFGAPVNSDVPALTHGDFEFHGDLASVSLRGPAKTLEGDVQIDAKLDFAPIHLNGNIQWSSLRWALNGNSLRSASGSAAVAGWLNDYRATAQGKAVFEDFPESEFQLHARGDMQHVNVTLDEMLWLNGITKGELNAAWRNEPVLDWRIHSEQVEPAEIFPLPEGKIQIRASGRSAFGPTDAHTLKLSSLSGKLGGNTLAGSGGIHSHGGILSFDEFRLALGTAEFAAAGSNRKGEHIRWSLATEDLGELLTDAAGSVHTVGELSGSVAKPGLRGELTGRQLAAGSLYAEAMTLRFNVPQNGDEIFAIHFSATDSTLFGYRAASLQFSANGSRAQHSLDLKADMENGTLQLAANGAWNSKFWQGRINKFLLGNKDTGNWTLARSGSIRLGADEITVSEQCLQQASALLCAAGHHNPESWSAQAALTGAGLEQFTPWLPGGLAYEGPVTFNLLAGSAKPETVNLSARFGAGSVSQTLAANTRPLLAWKNGQLNWTLKDQIWRGESLLNLTDGRLRADGSIDTTGEGPAALNLNLSLNTRELSALPVLIPDISRLEGEVTANLDLKGTTAAPEISGRAQLANGFTRIPRLGLDINNLHGELTATGQRITLDVHGESGEGALDGRIMLEDFGSDIRANGHISGENFLATNTQEYKARISPKLDIEIKDREFYVNGDLKVPWARIEPRDLRSAVQPSGDQVFTDAPEDHRDDWRAHAHITTTVGDDVRFEGFGLTTGIIGQLDVSAQPRTPPLGNGRLRLVNGNYRAYGQNLNIAEGELIYNGQPLAEPGLNLRAERVVNEEISVGVSMRGTLRQPETLLYSTPPMPQSQQLSYLLLGRSLDASSSAEQSQLDNAAIALGIGGSTITGTLRETLDLEEVSMQSLNDPTKASLVLGKRLSPDLYVSYGIGLFEAANTFRIRYRLSAKWALEAVSGLENSADFIYTHETD